MVDDFGIVERYEALGHPFLGVMSLSGLLRRGTLGDLERVEGRHLVEKSESAPAEAYCSLNKPEASSWRENMFGIGVPS
jgi:hypothetical protein